MKRKKEEEENCEQNEEEDESEDEDECPCDVNLGDVKTINYTFENISLLEQRGKLNFRPYYQRQFKWKMKQSSLFVESALIGYPCPEVTFLEIDAKGNMECMDGQQRLTTLKNYTQNIMADSWKNGKNKDLGFRLKSLGELKHLENKLYKDLSEEHQEKLNTYNIRCCVLPRTWPIHHVITYFKRIQGGGTKMTNQEIRRVISQGEFTVMLDTIANSDVVPYSLLRKALDDAKIRVDRDQYQEYFLRFFTLQICNLSDFGMPSILDHTLDTMKRLNKECKTTDGSGKLRIYERRLRNALDIVLQVFPDANQLFQRPLSLHSLDRNNTVRVWTKNSRINMSLWDCILFAFAEADKATMIENRTFIHDAFVDLMQTSERFTAKKLNKKDTQERIFELQQILALLEKPVKDRPLYGDERREIIKQWRDGNKPCAICKQPLSNFDELCHVDHTLARACGGATSEFNLGVTHKICNLKKGKK